jgi:arylsulfatase A-like enzyme
MLRRMFVLSFTLVLGSTTNLVADDRPNIIYVMLDDAGYGDFAAFGSKHIQTPHFDRMCREGTKFTQHYSGSAVCAPTRCVLMTGLDTGHCRRRGNTAAAHQADFKGRPLVPLKDGDITVAEALKKAGYVTGGIGKWGLGNPGTGGEPERQGFDHWYGYIDQVHAHDHFTNFLYEDGRRIPLPGNTGGKKKTYVHDLLEAKTDEFVRRYKDKPFFLYLAYTLPHGKYVIPHDDPAYKPYADKSWSQQVRNYAAMVTRADSSVGKLLALLKELEIDDNTIVFYTSDNGPNPPFVKLLDSAGGLRGIKRRLTEGGIRAAMTVRWPGKVPTGKTSEFIWGMRDVFPTVCELAKAKAPENLSGMSVVPTLLGKPQDPHPHLYWEFHSPFQQAVRKGKWKALRFGTKERVELYDLDADFGEKKNVAATHPAVAAELAKIMDTARVESRYWPAREHRAKKKPRRKKK